MTVMNTYYLVEMPKNFWRLLPMRGIEPRAPRFMLLSISIMRAWNVTGTPHRTSYAPLPGEKHYIMMY